MCPTSCSNTTYDAGSSPTPLVSLYPVAVPAAFCASCGMKRQSYAADSPSNGRSSVKSVPLAATTRYTWSVYPADSSSSSSPTAGV